MSFCRVCPAHLPNCSVAGILIAHCDLMQTTIKELRKGAQETKIELESRKQQQQQQQPQ